MLPVMADPAWLETTLFLQRGLLTREQVLNLVTTSNGIHHRLRPGGPWRRVLPGVYLTTTGALTFEQMLMAAQLHAGTPSFITGLAALSLQGVRGPRPGKIDVLVPKECFVASRSFVAIHRTRRMPAELHQDREIRYATGARAVADAIRGVDQVGDARTIVASAIQRHACTVPALTKELSQRHDRRDAMLRRVLTEVSAGIRSAPEGDLRDLITPAGLPQPLYNPALYLDHQFLASPDAWWPGQGVAAEVDSREFHLLPDDWQNTMARHRKMTAAGIAVLHFSPAQLREQPDQILAEITAALRNGRPLPAIHTVPAG
jgi:hypothetical protein